MLVDSADESLDYTVENAMEESEREVYELLVRLEAKGWDGLAGLSQTN